MARDGCPFCGADLTETDTAWHLQRCTAFYDAFEKDPPEKATSDDRPADGAVPEYVERAAQAVGQAREKGKWIGTPPAGFAVNDEGYLTIDKPAFVAIRRALTRIHDGVTYADAARDTPVGRRTLRQINESPERRRIYLNGEATDPRIQRALDAWDATRVDGDTPSG